MNSTGVDIWDTLRSGRGSPPCIRYAQPWPEHYMVYAFAKGHCSAKLRLWASPFHTVIP